MKRYATANQDRYYMTNNFDLMFVRRHLLHIIGLLQYATQTCARRMSSSVCGRRSVSSPCISATATTTAETGATRRTVQVGVKGAGRGGIGVEGGWVSQAGRVMGVTEQRPVYTYRLRLRFQLRVRHRLHQIYIVPMETYHLMGRMGSVPILPMKQSVSIDTMINFDGHGDGHGLKGGWLS